jgi:peptidyl-prolyl cis-trans isomerase D
VLQSLRKYSNSTGVKILYALLALLFVVWGVGAFGGSSVDLVAEVQGARVTKQDLDRQTAQLQRRYEQLLKGLSLPASFNLRAQALEELIEAALVQHEVQRLGLDVSSDEVDQTILHLPELQQNGRFSRDLLERVLRAERDRGEFEESIRRGLRAERLQRLIDDGVHVSDADVEERYKLDHEKVNLAFVRIAAADLGKTATLADDDLEKERTAHEDRYRTPTTVRARYVAYRRADFAAQAAVGEAEARAYYQSHLDDRFTDPEEVRARHILVKVAADADQATRDKARAEADDLLKQARGGADFAALAQAHSGDTGSAEKGGDLGFFPHGKMVPSFDAAAFALEPGQVSDVVESPFGFHVIKVEEKRPGGPKPFEAVRDQIVQELTNDRALELARTQAESDRRTVVRGKSLADAVGGRKVEETPPFEAKGEIPGVGRVQAFNDAAFNLDPNQVSDLIETDDAIYMLTPFDRKEPTLPPLADIRDKVEPDARRTAGERLAKEKAELLLTSAKTVGLEKAAAQLGEKVDETGDFERHAGVIPKLGVVGELRTDAFALTPETPLAPRTYLAGGDAVVTSLRSRTPADMKDFDGAKQGIRETLQRQRSEGAWRSFMSHLKQQAVQAGTLVVHGDEARRG